MRALPITLCSTLRSLFARWRCRSASAPGLATGGGSGAGHCDFPTFAGGARRFVAPPPCEARNGFVSQFIVRGGAIPPGGGGGVKSSKGKQHETSKAKTQPPQPRL